MLVTTTTIFKDAEFGPESDIGSEVDSLVGGDYYWHFLKGKTDGGSLDQWQLNKCLGEAQLRVMLNQLK